MCLNKCGILLFLIIIKIIREHFFTSFRVRPLNKNNERQKNNCFHSMNNTTIIEPTITILKCLPVQDKIPLLSSTVRQILATIHIIIMSAGTPANTVVTYLIYKTEQYGNQSTRLILFLSIIDIFGTPIINGASALYMLSYEYLRCTSILVMHTLVNYAISINYAMLLGITFDRMLRVRYLNEYSRVFTPYRFKLVIVCLFLLASVQAFLVFSGFYFLGYGYATILSAPLHVICAVFMVACYVSSIKKLKEMNTVSQQVSTSDRSVVKIASLHLGIFVACIMPILVWQVASNVFLSKILSEVIDVLVIFVLYVLISLHSTLNAFMFLFVNREARRRMSAFLQRFLNCFRSIAVQRTSPEENQPEPRI